MLITKEVEVLLHGSNVKYYEDLNYDIPRIKNKKYRIIIPKGTKITVKIEDLQKGTHIEIQCLCDYCLEEGIETVISKPYYKYISSNVNGIIQKDCCENCSREKIKESNLKIHGVEWRMQTQETRDRFTSTMLERHDVEHGLQVQGAKEKQVQTFLNNFGEINPMKFKEIRLKQIESDINNHNGKRYVQTQDFRDLMRETMSGANAPNWQGGISNPNELLRHNFEYKKWRTSVFEQDNYTCQCCGKRGVKLRAHHLLPFSVYIDYRHEINNGITLCENCHDVGIKGSFHNTYGTLNTTYEQLQEYIKDKEGRCFISKQFEDFILNANSELINNL